MVDRKIIEIVKNYIRDVTQKGIKVSRVFLYGSYARGESTLESDIDLLIISPLFEERNDKLKAQLWLIAAEHDYRIEPCATGEKKFLEDDYSPLFAAVKLEGIEIKSDN